MFARCVVVGVAILVVLCLLVVSAQASVRVHVATGDTGIGIGRGNLDIRIGTPGYGGYYAPLPWYYYYGYPPYPTALPYRPYFVPPSYHRSYDRYRESYRQRGPESPRGHGDRPGRR